MKKFHKILGLIFIIAGIITYATPIPGSTLLIILGFVWLMGKKKTLDFLRYILSHRMFKFLKIKKVVEEI